MPQLQIEKQWQALFFICVTSLYISFSSYRPQPEHWSSNLIFYQNDFTQSSKKINFQGQWSNNASLPTFLQSDLTKSTVFSGNYLYHPLPDSWEGDLTQLETFSISFEGIPQQFLISGDQSFFLSASSDPCQYKWHFFEFGPFCFFYIAHLHYCLIILQCSWMTNS